MLIIDSGAFATNLKTKIHKISAEEQAVVVTADDGNIFEDHKRIPALEDDYLVFEDPGEWGPFWYVVDLSAGATMV